VATAYWESGFDRAIGTVAEHFRGLADAGKLEVADPLTAAQHFAGLLVWIPSNRTLYSGRPDLVTDDELEGYARAGANVFLRAYRA
jgi:TetR/AcrR family transcriptional repressor of mexJK operon